jgi:PRC-barrel domain
MHVLSRVCLISAVGAVLLGNVAVTPGAGQAGAVHDPLGTPAADPAARPADRGGSSTSRRSDLESVLGREIRTRVEEDVGRVIDLLADRNGQVRAAVIEFGGFMGIGTRKIAVEWSALRFEGEGKQPAILLEMTRDQLRRAPEYKPNEPAVVRKAGE